MCNETFPIPPITLDFFFFLFLPTLGNQIVSQIAGLRQVRARGETEMQFSPLLSLHAASEGQAQMHGYLFRFTIYSLADAKKSQFQV